MTFKVSVNYSQRVHVMIDKGSISSYFKSLFKSQVDLCFLDMKEIEKRLGHVFKNNNNIRYLRNDSHQKSYIWVS